MRTQGLRVHLTSFTLILVITVSGQECVGGVRQGLYFCLLQLSDYPGAGVDRRPGLLSKHYSSRISLSARIRPERKMKCCS